MKLLMAVKRDQKGLTFMEVVIAMMIAAIMLVGFLQTCNSSALMLRNIKYRVSAINLAQAEIEDVKALGYDGAVIGVTITNVLIDEGATAAGGDDVTGTVTTTITNTTSGPDNGRKIVAQITWNVLGMVMQETLETVVYSYL